MEKYDALILGSGMGGLATGLLLAHKGKRVAILEKNSRPGGRFTSFERDGFMLDLGVHIISRGKNGPATTCLESTGLESPIDWMVIRPVQSTGGKIFKFPRDLEGMVPDEDLKAVIQFVTDVKGLSEEEIMALNDITLEEYLNRYTTNNIVHSCVSRVGDVYLVCPEWVASAGEFARCLQWEASAKSSAYPAGGCVSVANAYADGFKHFGGELYLDTKVAKVIVEGGKAVGAIGVDGKEWRADMVISNADIKHTVLDLVGEEHFDEEYVNYVNGLEYSLCSPVVRIGLDTVLDSDIKMLGQFYAPSQHEYYEMLAREEIPEELNVFLVSPSNFDPATAPEGKQLVMLASPVEFMNDSFAEKYMEKMIDTAEGYIPGLREHAIFIDKSLPSQIAASVGEGGSVIGVAQKPGQVGSDRPKIKTPLDGLFLVGGEVEGSGVGVELVVGTAMKFVENYVD
ncbi:MAG: NAD(P)/FAD-dependent oxidoreductase [Gordonibacter sp.]|uniref:phytoene desaturase family protein n=1 Tax=Gordonibacter sp. TaxID=1968902 RepID=UPI002FC78747